ncbi:MAG: hypothetical protein HXK16_08190 [Alloprevotella sp.]|nr:hypothetical protein [Alloprevotella sp.]
MLALYDLSLSRTVAGNVFYFSAGDAGTFVFVCQLVQLLSSIYKEVADGYAVNVR